VTLSDKSVFSLSLLCTVVLSLVLAATGSAYGATETLHNFMGAPSDGSNPYGALIFDSAGNLYGTTEEGGTGACGRGCGTVYKLSPSAGGWTESVIYNFGTGARGPLYPSGALITDASGNFYGLAAGGYKGQGAIYKLSPGSGGTWSETTLYSFGAVPGDGNGPIGKLEFDASGNLWGVTAEGGAKKNGTVFELVPSSSGWTEKVVYSFPFVGTSQGSQPSGIIFDNAGNLYGVTTFGGATGVNGAGVMFRLENSGGTWKQVVVHEFSITGTSLQTPTGGMSLDATGTILYMTMSRGGHGGGGIVALNLTTKVASELYGSGGSQTIQPYEAMAFDSSGNLYSASYDNNSGTCQCGFVYELSPGASKWTATTLANMNGTNGANPVGGVVIDALGNLYGATFSGGANKLGVVYEVTP
jgi:uncharacterized repeat protein (TIGR03803 family)